MIDSECGDAKVEGLLCIWEIDKNGNLLKTKEINFKYKDSKYIWLFNLFTGIDIHPGATIGERFFIDHGTGVVIGETCLIGNGVRLYQGVTLGAKSFPLDEQGNPIKGIPRHPILEDEVIVYSGATILGRITIGKGAMIGGNVWLTRSVPAGARITMQPVRQQTFENGGGI